MQISTFGIHVLQSFLQNFTNFFLTSEKYRNNRRKCFNEELLDSSLLSRSNYPFLSVFEQNSTEGGDMRIESRGGGTKHRSHSIVYTIVLVG